MSKESVEAMMEAATGDESLQQKLASASSFEEVVKIGSDHDYSFSSEELQLVLTEKGISLQNNSSESEELSDEQLETFAGGMVINWYRGW